MWDCTDGYGRATGHPSSWGAPGETGPGDRGTDTGRSTAGPARAGRDEERAGGDCSRVRDPAPAAPQRRNRARVPELAPPSMAQLLWNPAGSRFILFLILCFLTPPRSPGAPTRARPGSSRRRGRYSRRAADLGAYFPAVCARDRSPRGRSGRAPTFLGPGTPGSGVRGLLETGAVRGIARRCVLELEANPKSATCERSARQKRQETCPLRIGGAEVLKTELRSLGHTAGATTEGS